MSRTVDRVSWFVVSLYVIAAVLGGGTDAPSECGMLVMPWFLAACALTLLAAVVVLIDVRRLRRSRARAETMRPALRLCMCMVGFVWTCVGYANNF